MTNTPTTFFGWIIFLIQQYHGYYLQGLLTTLETSLAGTICGCFLGFLVGIIQATDIRAQDNMIKKILLGIPWVIAKIYVTIFRGTPMIVQAMVIYYGSSTVFGIDLKPFNAAIFIILLNTGAYMSETVRGGILSIDPGQTEGAKAIGMTHVQTMLYVILPQALRNIMPQIGNNLIINIKDSCVLSVIGVAELLYKTKAAAGALYMNFETYTITMIMYFIMTFTCSRLLRLWEKKMDGADNFDLATTDTLAYTSGMYRYPDDKKEEQ